MTTQSTILKDSTPANTITLDNTDGVFSVKKGEGSTTDLLVVDSTGITTGLKDASVTPAKLSQPPTLRTALTASGTNIDFTAIPSWVKRITILFHAVSTNGTSGWLIQLGDSGGIETTGYANTYGYIQHATASTIASATNGFNMAFTNATISAHGAVVITKLNDASFAWIVESSNVIHDTGTTIMFTVGSKTLSGVLTTVRLTTVNGTDSYDAGSVNIMYEG